MNFNKRVNGSWTDTPHYIHNTSTDTITTLPAVLYPNDTTVTVGLKGNMSQTGTPSPTTPIQPSECGERTGNLVPEVSTENGWRKGFLSNGNYSPIQYYGEWLSPMISLDGLTEFTISAKPTSDASMSVYWFDDSTYLSQTNATNYTGSTFDTIPSNATQFCYAIRTGVNGNTPPEGWWTMLNLGSEPLPYEPYGVKIPILNNSQTTNVYLGEVETTRNIKKIVFDGSESGWSFATLSGHSGFIINLSNTASKYPISNTDVICTHYRTVYGNNNGVIYTLTDGRCVIVDDRFTTADDFKAYLAQQYAVGTPVCVWYVLVTPETGIVNEPLRKIGDYADTVSGITIPTIAGANTLSIGTTLQPSEVTATYKGWHKASEIVHRYQYGEWDGSPPPTYPVYGFKIDKNNDDPDTRVTYLYDAEGMTPAYMDFSNGTFNYGSWANAWFIKNNRPVALKFDGTVDYELNHTDFTKKLDGTASDVEDSTYTGNFMSEMPTVYVKRWEDNDYNYMAFCEIPYDEDFLAQAHTNANGTVNNAIYLPMFKGSVDSNNKMRSLMGTYPTGSTTTQNEINYSAYCGTGWQIWDKAKIDLIMDLIVLITKSTNCRGKIGNGNVNTWSSSASAKYGMMKSGYETNGTTRSANAQFYGSEGANITGYGKHHMCAFYIEDLWGNRSERCLGFNIHNNVYKVKMTLPYTINSDSSYDSLAITPPVDGWLKNISSDTYGSVPIETNASDSTGFANYFFKADTSTTIALFGGNCNAGLKVGRLWNMRFEGNFTNWGVGSSPCYNNPT